MLRKVLYCFLLVFLILSLNAQTRKDQPKYKNSSIPIEERVNDLLSRMTLEEKIAQLQCSMKRAELEKVISKSGLGGVGPVLRSSIAREAAEKANALQRVAVEKSRLGIPVIIHDEALHGLIGNGATSFPQAIGLAATWDADLVSEVATVIAKETRSRGIRQVLSPVVNIARDVRWGRVEETYGEDPYLQSRMGVAFCKPIENEGVITTPKHFIANFGDGGRDSYPVHISERELREVYFPPFKACVQEANAQSVMAAYNALDDIPCSANRWLLTDILRKEWGFIGFVVSDYGSVAGIKDKHFVAATGKETATKAIEAGLDMELPDIEHYGEPLLEAVREGPVLSAAVDAAVKNVLRAKFKLGLFENPYVNPEKAEAQSNSSEHRQLARQAAREAIVLLRNKKDLLPLKKDITSIAVLGPNADSAQPGGYSGFGMKIVTVFEGIKNKVGPATQIQYAKGCEVGFASLPPMPAENLFPPNARPGEHGLKGEYFTNKDLSGTPVFTRIDKQIHFEWAMGSPDAAIPPDHFSIRWTGKIVPATTGIYTLGASTDDGVRLTIDGKLLINSWFDRGATLDAVTLTLEAGKQYDIRIEYYENEGWSYASLDWELKTVVDPRIQEAIDAAKKSDVALIVTGIIEGEGYDRANLDLPGRQEQLIRAVAATGTPTVVVLINGSAVSMKNWIDSVGAVVEAWYPGEEGGNAIADVLFGDYTPGGKLPVTFPQFVGQVPLYYNNKPTGRGNDYSDMSGKPLFSFGYGLSYTTFAYSNLNIVPTSIPPDGKAVVSVDVQNTGTCIGDEVVQLYTHDPVACVTRPVKELKGFKRITLAPEQKKTVSFELSRAELSFLDGKLKSIVEPGAIEVMIGSSCEDIRLRSSLEATAR
jgi:beta-glucosidase